MAKYWNWLQAPNTWAWKSAFSNNLSFNSHIQNVTTSASRSLGFLKRNIRSKNPELRELVYKSLVSPLVEYSSSVWSTYTILPGLKWFKVERPAGLLVNTLHMQVWHRCSNPLADGLLSREGPTPDFANLTRSYMVLLPLTCLHMLFTHGELSGIHTPLASVKFKPL